MWHDVCVCFGVVVHGRCVFVCLFCVLKCGCKLVDGCFTILVSIVVSIPACHAGDPGSIPGRGALFASFPTIFAQNMSAHRLTGPEPLKTNHSCACIVLVSPSHGSMGQNHNECGPTGMD